MWFRVMAWRTKKIILVFGYFYLCMLVFICGADNFSRQQVLSILLNNSDYDSRIAPNFEQDTATNVSIQIYILSIHSVSEMTMDYSVDIFLRQKWIDPRLEFTRLSNFTRLELGQKMIDKVWVPDTIIANEKKAHVHQITVPNKLMHLYRNGTVFFSSRIGLTMDCHMNLEKFPLDSQFCPVFMESYGYTTENLVFHWREYEPVQLSENIQLAQFYVKPDIYVDKCNRDYGEAGQFACLEAGVFLSRNRGYYAIQIFVPSILIVMLSWVSFWIDIDATPARISLGVLTVLTMTTQSSGARSQLPRVSYVKAIDIWMSACLFFVFAGLIEYAYANVLLRRRKKNTVTDSSYELKLINQTDSNAKHKACSRCPEITITARYVDKLSRIIFPASFLIFNIIFWTYYLHIHDFIFESSFKMRS